MIRTMRSATAIVVSYETRDLLARCLGALRRERVESIVVDNASRDDSAALVRVQFPEVALFALERNVGFGAACNVGARAADTPYILVLNPDTEPRAGAVEALVACCSASDTIAGATPRVVDERGRESTSVLRYPSRWWRGAPPTTSVRGIWPRRPTTKRGTLEGEYAIGAALLLRRDAFLQIGGFDPGFFLYYEEVDLCRRLQAAGWSIERCPEAEVVHVGGAATRTQWSIAYRQQLRGHLRYIGKHEGRRAAVTSRLVLLGAVLLRYLLSRGDRRAGYKAGLAWLATVDLDSVAAPGPAPGPVDGLVSRQ
jgi:N-acetylglucosaminyl-diphospho-decaprenol L-rhamnosyltransferase